MERRFAAFIGLVPPARCGSALEMDDTDRESMATMYNNLLQLNLRIASKVTKLQVRIEVLETLAKNLALQQGFDPGQLDSSLKKMGEELEQLLLDELKSWVAERRIATPKPDDGWWDRK